MNTVAHEAERIASHVFQMLDRPQADEVAGALRSASAEIATLLQRAENAEREVLFLQAGWDACGKQAVEMLGDIARLARERDALKAQLARANKTLLFVDGYFNLVGTFNGEVDAVVKAARERSRQGEEAGDGA